MEFFACMEVLILGGHPEVSAPPPNRFHKLTPLVRRVILAAEVEKTSMGLGGDRRVRVI